MKEFKRFKRCAAGHPALNVMFGSVPEKHRGVMDIVEHYAKLCESDSDYGWRGCSEVKWHGAYSDFEIAMRFMRMKGYRVKLGYGDCPGFRTCYAEISGKYCG